jgi:hypothetical protein
VLLLVWCCGVVVVVVLWCCGCCCVASFGSTFDSQRHDQPTMPKVVVLEFSRSPQWFLNCLVGGDDLDKHRVAMLAVGRPCIVGGDGAKLFVSPDDVNDVLFHLSSAGITFDNGLQCSWDDLRSRHVIVSEALETDVMDALKASKGSGSDGGKGKDNVRVKHRVVIDVPPAAWHDEVDPGFLYSLSL